MAEYTFTDSQGKRFTVKGSESLTEAQAREIFNKQASTGALVGLSRGDVINSEEQAAQGVKGASAAAIATTRSSVSAVRARLTGLTDPRRVDTPIAPINLGNLAKSTQGVSSMAGIPSQAVTAGLSAVQKLVNQPASVLSNRGLGCFGLDVKQLEVGGFVKPGTSNLLNQAGATVSNVLRSPTVWTGKDGVKSASAMLSNTSLQSLTQQNLMSTGLQGLSTLGIPVTKLDPRTAIGAALNAAKSIPGAAAWAKGLSLPSGVKTAFDQTAVSGAFGVNLSTLKANAPMLEEEKIVGSTNTVNRATLNAATQRILGDAKIPKLTYTE